MRLFSILSLPELCSRRAEDCGRESEDGRAVNQFRALLKEKTLERIA